MKKIIIILTFLIHIVTSCKEENIKYKYYDNGKVSEKIDFVNNIVVSYYNNENIEYRSGIKGDSLHGKFIRYYKNGTIKDSGYYNNNNQIGNWYYFSKSGKLEKVCNYTFVVNRGNLLNEVIFFDENGDTIQGKGHSYRIESYNDTINKNDTFKFDIIIEQSVFNDSVGVLVGDFDSIYNIRDTNNIFRFEGKNNIIKCFYKSNKAGKNIVRGIIFDHTFRNDSDLYRELFFSQKFFVKP